MNQKKKAVNPPVDRNNKEVVVQGEEMTLQAERFTKEDWALLLTYFVMSFLGCIFMIGRVSLIVAFVCLGIMMLRSKKTLAALREHFCLPVFGLMLFLLMYWLAGMYSPFNESAIKELYRGLVGYGLSGYAIMTFRRKHVPALMWGFNILCAIVAILAVDGATLSVLYTPYSKLAVAVGMDFENLSMFVDQRLATIFNNSNVGASLFALAMLLGLYQVMHLERKRSRFVAALLLGINAMAFFMCFSRGAILSFGVACLVYLAVTAKGNRIRVFLLMLISAIFTIVLSALSMPYLGTASILPMIFTVGCGPIIFLLDGVVSEKLAGILNRHVKLMFISGGVCALALVAVLVAAVTMDGPLTLDQAQDYRSVKLAPGVYTVTTDMDAGMDLRVSVATRNDRVMGKRSDVFQLSAGDTSFEIADDIVDIRIYLQGQVGDQVRDVTFSDGTKLHLDYPLLPATVAHRLQDNLLTSGSLLLRMQYMIDAVKIWATSPLYGRGLGSTENLYTTVQPYFYASMFVHNHVLQYMADMGLLGLLAFLLFMGGILWLLIRARKRTGEPLVAAFIAAWVMMNVHGLMDFCFSLRPYMVLSSMLLAIMVIQYGEPLLVKGKVGLKRISVTALVIFWTLLTVVSGSLVAYRTVHKVAGEREYFSVREFLDALESSIFWDLFDDDHFKLMYIANGLDYPEYHPQIVEYAKDIRAMGEYNNNSMLAMNFYMPTGQFEEMFACTREGIAQKASDDRAWNYAIEHYRDTILPFMGAEYMDAYLQGMEEFQNYLSTFNIDRIEPVYLNKSCQEFLDAALMVMQEDMDAEAAYAYLSTFIVPVEG